MQCWHLTFAADGRYPPFTESQRRFAVRKLAKIAGRELVLFCIVDEHIHVVVMCARPRAGLIGRSILRSLNTIAAVNLRLVDIRPVKSRSHLVSLVRYLLVQVIHHDVQNADPALWSGSCFLDMVGARVVEGLQLRLWDLLPRFRLRTVYEHVGLPLHPLEPLGDSEVRAAGVARILSATSAALALDEHLEGKSSLVMLGKRTVTQLSHQSGAPTTEVAWALGVTTGTARRLLKPTVDVQITRAARVRLALEVTVQARARMITDAANVMPISNQLPNIPVL